MQMCICKYTLTRSRTRNLCTQRTYAHVLCVCVTSASVDAAQIGSLHPPSISVDVNTAAELVKPVRIVVCLHNAASPRPLDEKYASENGIIISKPCVDHSRQDFNFLCTTAVFPPLSFCGVPRSASSSVFNAIQEMLVFAQCRIHI